MKQIALALLVLGLAACSTPKPLPTRDPAAGPPECLSFNAESAEQKSNDIAARHVESASAVIKSTQSSALQDETSRLAYVEKFYGGRFTGFGSRTVKDTEAFAETGKFLADHHVLDKTLTRSCDFFESPPAAKMVHALGTLANGHMVLYERLRGADGSPLDKESPWTGLFDPKANQGQVPVWLRFSIANPVGLPGTQFIPGLGLKFLIDGRKSVDLVAMESLAGQGNNQDYFALEFSPDFSAHAPPAFNTAKTSDEQRANQDRYKDHLINRHSMNDVGDSFFAALKDVDPYAKEIQGTDETALKHSTLGPHPFAISIQPLASVTKDGGVVAMEKQRRPWRLVFAPARDRLKSSVTDGTPYKKGQVKTDFRYKLAHLAKGDVIYYVVAETESGARYRLGEIVIDSPPFPSAFSDKEFFIQHEIETARRPENKSWIAEPN